MACRWGILGGTAGLRYGVRMFQIRQRARRGGGRFRPLPPALLDARDTSSALDHRPYMTWVRTPRRSFKTKPDAKVLIEKTYDLCHRVRRRSASRHAHKALPAAVASALRTTAFVERGSRVSQHSLISTRGSSCNTRWEYAYLAPAACNKTLTSI